MKILGAVEYKDGQVEQVSIEWSNFAGAFVGYGGEPPDLTSEALQVSRVTCMVYSSVSNDLPYTPIRQTVFVSPMKRGGPRDRHYREIKWDVPASKWKVEDAAIVDSGITLPQTLEEAVAILTGVPLVVQEQTPTHYGTFCDICADDTTEAT